ARRILSRHGGVVYADGVGTGKTEIGLAFIEEYALEQGRQALVVCPAQLRENWRQRIAASRLPAEVLSFNELAQDEQNVILTIVTADTPRVREDDRVTIAPVSQHFSRVSLKFGYMETPNVPKALAIARRLGWQFDIMSTSFFLSRRALRPAVRSGMPRWQDRLFIGLAKSASDATDFFQIPTGRVVEVGTQVTV
ncbi:MAG: hypothetical protein WEA28_01800, partial [Xanthobacteraceae bacterium]